MAGAPDLSGLGRLWLVGCGNLGSALLAGWMNAGLDPAMVTVIDPSPRGVIPGVAYTTAPALPRPDTIVLAVKPQMLADVAQGLTPFTSDALIVSVLAGVQLQTLGHRFPGARIVRALPNTAARIGRSAVLLAAGPDASPRDRAMAEMLMSAVGRSWWIAEPQMDAATAVAASGPAFLFRFIEAMGAAGRAAGLPDEVSDALALEMVAGSAALAAIDGRPPAALREEVTSPNGMTQAGLEVLDGTGALSTLVRDTVRAAARRSAELGKEAG